MSSAAQRFCVVASFVFRTCLHLIGRNFCDVGKTGRDATSRNTVSKETPHAEEREREREFNAQPTGTVISRRQERGGVEEERKKGAKGKREREGGGAGVGGGQTDR